MKIKGDLNKVISIIIPFYDEVELISRAVDSVFMQEGHGRAVEVIVINDGNLAEDYISEIIDHAGVNVIKNQYPKGPGGARNTGLDAATGDYLAFLDADDFWLPGKLFAQLSAVEGGATFVATGYRINSDQATIMPPVSLDRPIDVFLRRGIGTSTVLITRALLAELRFKDIRFAQDIDFWFGLACSPLFRYANVDFCLAQYSSAGSTKNKWKQLQYFYKVIKINDLPFPVKVRALSSYVLSGIFNHFIKRLFN